MSNTSIFPMSVGCYLRVFHQDNSDRTYLVMYSQVSNDVLYLELDKPGTAEILKDKFGLPVVGGKKDF